MVNGGTSLVAGTIPFFTGAPTKSFLTRGAPGKDGMVAYVRIYPVDEEEIFTG